MSNKLQKVPILRFKQWVPEWDNYEYSLGPPRRKPPKFAYVFSMKAKQLHAYSTTFKRKRDENDEAEGIQRFRDEKRTERIRRFVRYGYPYGDLKPSEQTEDKRHLLQPGWLPTSIVINILKSGDKRRGKNLKKGHIVKVSKSESGHSLILPKQSLLGENALKPFEVIDGQHRLWAFDELHADELIPDDFELPVVAFHGLDIAWQAYLFWSINVSPKKINPSHAFDLYPLLRTQHWLMQNDDLSVYREARAQEITDWIYKFKESSWYRRINMLGEKGAGRVSQVAWVRSLVTSFFGTGKGRGRYGLYNSPIYEDPEEPLNWDRSQQIVFLMEFWSLLKKSLGKDNEEEWNIAFKKAKKNPFSDKSSMLNQDMGVKAIHSVLNDIFYSNCVDWGLDDWEPQRGNEPETSEEDIELSLTSLRDQGFYNKLEEFADILSEFDWRSLDGPDVRKSRALELEKRAYRGSGGYSLLIRDLFQHIFENGLEVMSSAAEEFLPDDGE